MSAILFDLDGVLYEGDSVIAGAADAVGWFTENHIPHLFLTNTTSKPRTALVDKLSSYGISTKQDEYLTPPVAAVSLLHEHGCKRIALFVPEATKSEFSDFELCEDVREMADAVVIGDLAEDWTFERLNQAFSYLMNNPQCNLIALGLTRYWRTQKGLQLDAGPFVKALEYASGREVMVTGKPAIEFYDVAKNKLAQSDEIVMIGDDIRGDIEAAQTAGLKAILVRSGKFSAKDLSTGIQPDALLDSVADLPDWWQKNMSMS